MGGCHIRWIVTTGVIVSALFVSSTAVGQSPYWQNFDDSKMSVRAVDTIGTDIWACTENGVMILDPGTGRDSIALDSVNAWDIGHLPNGSIWVGTPGGLWVYHQGNWTNLETTNSNLRSNVLLWITVDPATGVWFVDGNVLYNYPGTGPIDTFNIYEPDSALGDISLTDVAVRNADTLWLTSYSGLLQFADSTWTLYTDTNSAIPSTSLEFVSIAPSGAVWVAADTGLIRYDGATWDYFKPWDSTGSPPGGSPWTVYVDDSNEVWTGYGRSGLLHYDGTEWTYRRVSPDAANDEVLGILRDSTGAVWAGTATDGLLRVGPVEDEVYAFGLAGRVRAIAPATGDSIWFGTNRGLCIRHGTDWTTYNVTNSGLPSNFIWDIAFDEAGWGWLATDAGLVRFTGTNWIVFDSSNSDLMTGWPVSTVAVDSNNHVWTNIAAFKNILGEWTMGGVVRWDGSTWTKFTPDNSAFPARPVNTIEVDRFVGVWVGTYNSGVAYYDGLIWTVYDPDNSPLPDTSVAEIAIDNTGVAWFGTEILGSGSGVAFFDGSIWGVFNTSNSPLTSNRIMGLAIDQQDDVWVGTTGAIHKWDGLNWTPVDTSGGLSFTYPHKMAFAPDGGLWVATTYAGLFRLDPAIATAVDDGLEPELPDDYLLSQNYPNPFNPSTTIEYSLPVETHATVDIINLLGRRVATLVNRKQPAGSYQVIWDGSDDSGKRVASGVYFYRLTTADGAQSRKMLLLK